MSFEKFETVKTNYVHLGFARIIGLRIILVDSGVWIYRFDNVMALNVKEFQQ